MKILEGLWFTTKWYLTDVIISDIVRRLVSRWIKDEIQIMASIDCTCIPP
jgi:hypothetical protein